MMARTKGLGILTAISFSFTSLALFAQTPDTGTIRGTVVDETGAPLPGVKLIAWDTLTHLQRATETDASGRFFIGSLPIAGSYQITATKSGFTEASIADIHLASGSTAYVQLRLSPSGGKTEVTV